MSIVHLHSNDILDRELCVHPQLIVGPVVGGRDKGQWVRVGEGVITLSEDHWARKERHMEM